MAMLQVVFSAGSVFLLLALQATASLRIGYSSLKAALAQVERCIGYLQEIGQPWPVSSRTADILRAVLDNKLRPVLARRIFPCSQDVTDSPEPLETEDRPPVPPDAGIPRPTSLLPTDATHADGWTPQAVEGADWPHLPLDLFPQPPGDIGGSQNRVPAQNTLPEWDVSEFLSTFDWFGAPELGGASADQDD